MVSQFAIIIPEILLTALAMVMQILAVYAKKSAKNIMLSTIIIGLGITYYILHFSPEYEVGFTSSFVNSKAIGLFKAIVLSLALISIVVYHDMIKIVNGSAKIEFITLVLLSTVGIFISISARDFLLLFCGLELQALSGYALAAFNTKNSKSSEAGLKYFILGALMTALMLFGISFLYGFSGSIKYFEIRDVIESDFNMPLMVGSVLVLAAILFKFSAAPLHIWTPDVYEGSPICVLAYFATAQKFGMFIVLINILDGVIGDNIQVSNGLIKIVSMLSMIIGAFGAIRQNSLKRLMAYSTVLNSGYVLIAVCLDSQEGNYAAFIYMLIYVISVMGFFTSLIALLGAKSEEATFSDLQGIAGYRKTLALVISVIMFSMIGLPPLAGFFGKYYVLYNAVAEGEISLALIGIISSVIAAFYYLKVVKYMYFMEPVEKIEIISTKKGLWIVTVIVLAFIIFFFTFAQKYIL